ncbi:AraC family transcriptional regulator [Nonomuraea salmonea]|jgi:AraC-like DNA-binding protein|uniref:AraC family transcriptional regulator n=1 Tax=Nonomuraea salmonea TaxID=46181 RepID=A0ABV5NE54_9ACTN
MDLLSDVVALMRTGRPISARISWRAPWSHAFPSAPGSASFHIVLRGSCWFVPSTGEPVPLSVGDVLFLPHGDAYGLADDPDEPLPPPVGCSHDDPELFASAGVGGSGAETVTLTCGYRLHPRVSHPILRSLPPVIHLPATLGCHPELRAAVELLAGEIDNPRPGADTIVTSLLDAVQLYVLRAWFSSDELCTCGGWAAALSDPAIGPALDAMHRAPDRRWTVESLGAQAGLSRAGFARRFTELVGTPPLAYLTSWRLATAARLLLESDAPVSEVAERVGYGSEFAFGNAFKREYGVAPGRFRRQALAPGGDAA